VTRRLLLLTPAELTRDARARRAVKAAAGAGYEVVGLCGQISGETPVPLDGAAIVRVGRTGRINPLWFGASSRAQREHRVLLEARGVLRLARTLVRSARLLWAGRSFDPAQVVHANDLETLPAGYLLARRSNARLVYDAHELYSEFEAPTPRIGQRLTLLLEGFLARRADAVVTVSDGMASELQQRLRLRGRPSVVMNVPHLVDVDPLHHENGSPVRAVYQGGLGPGRELVDLLAAAGADGVSLAIRIRMARTEALRETIARSGLEDRVEVLEPVPPDEVLDALRDFDVGVIFDKPSSRNSELSVPNKFFEYLMAGLAVVAPHLETIGPLVVEERIGTTYDPADPDGLARAIERIASDSTALGQMRRRARELATSRFNAEAAEKVLAEVWAGAPDGQP
jgi:glycosyltransferase involved in cell wall biosynthesis